jgi:hypothetical protein
MDSGLTSLIVDLYATIHIMAGYAPPTVMPQVHQVPQSEIQAKFCRGPCRIPAAYDPIEGVFLDEKLDPSRNTFDRSILLHELVHHLQSVSGRFDLMSSRCMRWNVAEQEAYALQNRYLMESNDTHRVSMTGWVARCTEAEVPTPGKK